jgi:cellulose synthase/poly-beta-1,6-N-acetylglucosamine synthase-like glycosyltransferase
MIHPSSDPGQLLTLAAYYAVLAVLALYGTHRGLMVYLYYRHRRHAPRPGAELAALPRVTVQLPIYNEVYVVDRLVEAVAELDYPRELLEIQILDDSTDETREAARRAADRVRARGIAIAHRTREHREGFKAGALQAGLQSAAGEYVLILDADFVPHRALLRECLPHFADPRVGMVQARWEHLNREYSALTRIQAILLDGHFVVEHTARHRSGRFFNFNGTAGIWRRTCIEDAGGWQSDTLTEDLDISYRAQLKGWKFVYLKDCVAAGEVPVDIHGFKSQQYRWTKGSVQTARKILPEVWRSPLPWKIKSEAFFHLTNNFSYPLMVLLALLMVPAIVIRERIGWQRLIVLDVPLFFGATFSFVAFYVSSQRENGRPAAATFRSLPFLLSLGVGLSVHNARAVLEAVFRRSTDFTRTPKYRIEGSSGDWKSKKYRAERSFSFIGETILAAYFLASLAVAIRLGYWAAIPFLLVFFNGFACTVGLSLASWWSTRPGRRTATVRAGAAG